MSGPPPIRVLLVEDDEVDRMAVQRALRATSIPTELCAMPSIAEAIDLLAEAEFDCAIVDYTLGDGTAVEFIERLHRIERRLPIVILTGRDDQATALTALERGAQDYLLKSDMNPSTLARSIEYAMARHRLGLLERRLVDADRLSAIGQLAAGVAHEVNNPACYILANLSFISDCLGDVRTAYAAMKGSGNLPTSPETKRLTETLEETGSAISDCIQGTERICKVVSELRPFSRIEHSEVEELNINGAIESALSIAHTEIRHRATLVKELGELPTIIGDRSKLGQVFVSLATNAAQAIQEGSAEHNTITVKSESRGDAIVVSFTDTGIGIPSKQRAHIFEPFYTTKSRGVGTGLGLAIAAETIRKHGGEISLDSDIGVGATFTVRIPHDTGLLDPRLAHSNRALKTELNARVLLIDDDSMVRSGLRRLLAPPHEVIEADSGVEALEILTGDRYFDVILCDLMMPELDGPAVYSAIANRDPDLIRRVVFLTGGAFTPRVKEFMDTVEAPVLQKPIGRQRLLEIVAEVSGT